MAPQNARAPRGPHWPAALGIAVGLGLGLVGRPWLDGPSPFAARTLAEQPAASAAASPRPAGGAAGVAGRLPMCSTTVRILSLDGGGMRGLIGATVLEELEAILVDTLGAPVRVGDFFDVVVGTSTGGLQAAALVIGHGASNLSDIYLRYGERIFSNATRNCKPHHRAAIDAHCSLDLYSLGALLYDCLPALAHCHLAYPTYATDGIEAVATELLGARTTADAFDGKVLGMTTYDVLRGTPITFSNLGATAASTYAMVDAALATSAAPTFFNPRDLSCVGCGGEAGARILGVDGALYANNPTLIAYELAERMAAERLGCALTVDRSLVLSLGTGRQRSELYRSGNLELGENTLGTVLKTVVQFLEYNDTAWWDEQWGALKWIFLPLTVPSLELLNAALIGQEELTDTFFKKVFGASHQDARYLRVNVDLSRFDRVSPFEADATNLARLRAIGAEAALSSRYRLSKFAEALIEAQAQRAGGKAALRAEPAARRRAAGPGARGVGALAAVGAVGGAAALALAARGRRRRGGAGAGGAAACARASAGRVGGEALL
jgi:patatin-like phospholipase/acyl hydrolase